MTGVYLLHFERRYRHAAHYAGWALDIGTRIALHRSGHGARLTQVIRSAGIGFVVARVWPGQTRTFERQLKRWSLVDRCPICTPGAGRSQHRERWEAPAHRAVLDKRSGRCAICRRRLFTRRGRSSVILVHARRPAWLDMVDRLQA